MKTGNISLARRFLWRVILVAVAIQPTMIQAAADNFPEPPHGPVVDIASAPIIVVGNAGASSSYWDEATLNVYTDTLFLVDYVEKGEAPAEITVRARGGSLPDGLSQSSEHEPVFKENQRSRLFLTLLDNGKYEVFGLDQGKQDAGYESVAYPAQCGTDFCTAGFQWPAFDIQPVEYRVNANTADETGEETAIQDGFESWEGDVPSRMDWKYAGSTTVTSSALDSVRAVYWKTSSNNYLGLASVWHSSGYLSHFDIEMNDSKLWEITAESGEYDIESVAVHEVGHALGLAHTSDPTQVMTGDELPDGVEMRSLGSGDRMAARILYPMPLGGVAAGDFNGDGYSDVAIGVPGEDDGTDDDAGGVNVLYGGATGVTDLSNDWWDQDSGTVANATEPYDYFGASLASGDFDNDSFDDLAIGVPGEEFGTGPADQGAVNVLYGSTTGLTDSGNQIWEQDTTDVEGVAEVGDAFGLAVASGDFNGDGEYDLAVGSPRENAGSTRDAGAVNVLYGTTTGLSASGDQDWDQDVTNVEESTETGDLFGHALAAGDFDADGQDELAIGVPGENAGSTGDSGGVNVLFGSAAGGLSSSGDQFWDQDSTDIEGGAESGDYFGWSVSVGSFGNSSHDDLAIGVPGENIGTATDAGGLNVIFGSTTGLAAAGDQAWNQDSTDISGACETGDYFGWSLASADFGNSSHSDLAIGVAYEEVDGALEAGAANILYGGSSGFSATGEQLLHQNTSGISSSSEENDRFGWALAGADMGNNAIGRTDDDIFFAVTGESIGTAIEAGGANVLYGTSSGISTTGEQSWNQNSGTVADTAESSDFFG